jgi:hypothetical protein
MAVPTARTDLSATASSNSPQGGDTIGASTGPDDYLRAHASLIRANYDDILLKAPLASPTFTGTVALPTNWSINGTLVTATAATLNGLASGTYTPTASDASGLTSVASLAGCYQRIGSVVSVAGSFAATATGRCYLSLTLPVSSNLAGGDLWGTGSATDVTNEAIYAARFRIDASGDKAIVEFWAAVDGDVVVQFNFSYIVK